MTEGLRYGYDPQGGHLFSWDGEYRYLGRASAPPPSAHIVEDRLRCELFGSFYLSGEQHRVITLQTQGPTFRLVVSAYLNGHFDFTELSVNVRGSIAVPNQRICLCGDAVGEPARVAAFAASYPFQTVHVCPLEDELAAFGVLAEQLCREHKERPRRATLAWPNEEVLDAEFQEFDEDLGVEGDGLGRMAHLVAHKQPVLNQMRMGPGVRGFYGSVVAPKGDGVWMMSPKVANQVLLQATPAVKYAAMSVPCNTLPNEEFCEEFEVDGPVPVMIANDFIPGTVQFMNFYKTIGRPVVCLIDPLSESAPRNAPVFRYSRGYRLTPTSYTKVLTQ